MLRRTAVLVGISMVVGAEVASARQPDERAAAFAFAAAFERFSAAIEPLGGARFIGPTEPACAFRLRRRIAEHRWDELNSLWGHRDETRVARQIAAPFLRFSTDLHAVATADPALRSGRAAVRRVRRGFAAMAALPRVDVCAEVRRYAASGLEPTPVMRRIRRARRAADVQSSEDIERRGERMEARMIELGVPETTFDPADDGR
jgi:hypothetical protein